ncbi:MAG: protein kinase [Parachlamydiaceae bacterium]|nr:MAG: protein kinase [Parachlamydiaceae bacterium]
MSGNGANIKPYDLGQVAQFGHDVAKGLAFLHKNGFVHGDVKPQNALLHDNRAVLIDFGTLVKEGADILAFTKLFLPPEYSEALRAGELKRLTLHWIVMP